MNERKCRNCSRPAEFLSAVCASCNSSKNNSAKRCRGKKRMLWIKARYNTPKQG